MSNIFIHHERYLMHSFTWEVGLRFNTSDPDIETIVRRIDRKIIDLQPDFQRGEVWSTAKKQRLEDYLKVLS